MDASTLLEILSPLFSGYFVLVASVANIGKNVSFLTASASRASLHQALSQRGNLGDITAKAGSQSIAASLVGTCLGIAISPLVGEDISRVAASFLFFSAFHQFCTYHGLKAVPLRSLNRHRLNILLTLFFQEFASATANKMVFENLTPENVSQHESFAPSWNPDDSYSWLLIGCPLNVLCPNGRRQLKELLMALRNQEKYILSCSWERKGIQSSNSVNFKVHLTFLEDAAWTDVVRGVFHAHTLRAVTNQALDIEMGDCIISSTHDFMTSHIDILLPEMKNMGWILDQGFVTVESNSAYRLRIEIE